MRRLLASTLVLLFAGATLAPSALATITPQTPACCRASGKHHCSAPAGSGFWSKAQPCHYQQGLTTASVAKPQSKVGAPALREQHPFVGGSFFKNIPPDQGNTRAGRGPPRSPFAY